MSRKSCALNVFLSSESFNPPFKVKLVRATFGPFPLLLVLEIMSWRKHKEQ